MPGDKSLTQRHVNCLSVLCYPSLMSGFGHCFPVGGRPLCQLSRDFCNQRTMEHCYDWLDMDMDIDMDRHGRQALWRNRFLVDKLTAHSLMDGLPWRSMHESLDLRRHVMMYKEVQTYARFLQLCSELRMISSMTSRIMNDIKQLHWSFSQRIVCCPLSEIQGRIDNSVRRVKSGIELCISW